MNNKLVFLILTILIIAVVAMGESWDADINLSCGSSSVSVSFGAIDGAAVLLDSMDEVIPVAPPTGSYAYFELDDPGNPYITMLSRDIRPDDGDSSLWILHMDGGTMAQTATWNSSELPPGSFMVGAHYPGVEIETWVNMKTESSIEFWPAQILEIVYTPTGYLPDGDPEFSEWYPADGATSVPVNTTIRFNVTDEGSGIDPSSITLTVDGTDVSADLELTAITDGYRVEYEASPPLAGESWISVIAQASDNASPANTADDVIAFRTGESISPVLWEFPFTAYTVDLAGDTSDMALSLGGDYAASTGFDMGLDIVYPVPPPFAFYAYFPLDDPSYPLYNKLIRDIHVASSITDTWRVLFGNVDATIGVEWEDEDLPTDKLMYVAYTFPPFFPEDGDWVDMTTIDHVEFGPGRQVWIKAVSPSGDTVMPRLVFTNPSDGETGIPVSTDIVAGVMDLESGIDTSTIAMWINSTEVTDMIEFAFSGETTFVTYTPEEDFDPLTTVEVQLQVGDMADPANVINYNWSFVTGYFLTPTWIESLAVWTSEPGEPLRHFALNFGADIDGTDLFDYGLDQQMPPPPPGDTPYGYFQIADTFWNELARDIRYSEDDDILWSAMIFRISPVGGTANWISWDPEGLPEDGSFDIAWLVSETDTIWENMRTLNRIDITSPGNLLIHFVRGVPTYCIAGTVFASDDGVLEGAVVQVGDSGELVDTTDEEGTYQICDVPMGEHTVVVSAEDYFSDTVDVAFDDNINRNFELDPLVTPEGDVFGVVSCDDDGSPEGAMVILGDDTTYADETGYYIFEAVPYGGYTMSVSLDFYSIEERDITVDEPDNEENFTLERQTGRIVGTIELSDDPPNLAGTSIEILESDIPVAYTNASGFYLMADVPYGEYDIRISRDGYTTLDTNFTLVNPEDTLDAELIAGTGLNPPRDLSGDGSYPNRAVIHWESPEPSSATLLGYNIYRIRMMSDDTLVGYVSEPFTSFVEWNLTNYIPYSYAVTAVYVEGESEPVGPTMVWISPSEADDIFIWDFDNGAMLAEGGVRDEADFMRATLESFGEFDVVVSGQDANINEIDLFEYRAVILITGVEDASDQLPNFMSCNKLAQYLAAGGRVYVEGADFGYDFGSTVAHNARKRLFRLFGVTFADDGEPQSTGNVTHLEGSDVGFFTSGPIDVEYFYRSIADHRVDEWGDSVATPVLESQESPPPEVSRTRMAYYTNNNSRSVLSSIYLGSVVNGEGTSTKEYMVAAVINYLLGTDVIPLVEEKGSELPEQLAISASPNPFNASCELKVFVDRPGIINVDIRDITGRKLITLADEQVKQGVYTARWDGKDNSGKALPSGVYFATMRIGGEQVSTKLMLLK